MFILSLSCNMGRARVNVHMAAEQRAQKNEHDDDDDDDDGGNVPYLQQG